jgi:hypothetical protein
MMMKRAYQALPGPTPVRVILAVLAILVFLVALNFVYEWMGTTFLDSGGTLG